jgi:hypothetical protein
MLVIKVLNKFSSSAKQLDELTDFFIFLKIEYSILFHHIHNRLLSMFAAVDRLTEHWTAIKLGFFFVQGEGNMSRATWALVAYENNCEVADEPTLPELYLYFCHNVMSVFNVSIKQAESNYIQITDIYSVLNKLLYTRILDYPERWFHFRDDSINPIPH